MNAVCSDRELGVHVDRLLLEQGRLDPLELLLALDLLPYADYEAWRLGRRPDLQCALRADPIQVAELLERAATYARAQGLAATPLEHHGWGDLPGPLQIGHHAGLVQACAAAQVPPPDRRQLDLFQDSSAQLLAGEIGQALAERRTDQARALVARLMRQDPRHRHLRGFLRLIQALDLVGTADPRGRLQELESITPLARALLGHRDRDLLAPLWVALAESIAERPFDPRTPQLHASLAWARAGRWESVRAAVEAEPRWRDQPVLVLAHGEACWRLRDLLAARRDWMGLCWDHPLEAEGAFATATFPDRRLADLWGAFGDLEPALEIEDFPAWVLLSEPGMAVAVPPEAAPADERGAAYHLLRRLIRGDDRIALRRELAEVHPELLRLFLGRRIP
jgi:hypothetical protein